MQSGGGGVPKANQNGSGPNYEAKCWHVDAKGPCHQGQSFWQRGRAQRQLEVKVESLAAKK
eukprot:9973214-Prorocentrum_lima.AAC.1